MSDNLKKKYVSRSVPPPETYESRALDKAKSLVLGYDRDLGDNLKTWPEVAHVGFTKCQLDIPEYKEYVKGGYYVSPHTTMDSVEYIRADIAKERETRLLEAFNTLISEGRACSPEKVYKNALKP